MENNKTQTNSKYKTISIERTLNLSIDTVWTAWSEPESFKKWWGPEGFTCPDCSIDFRIGGKCLASMQDEKGNKVWSLCAYKEIIPRTKIVYDDSFSDEKGNIVSSTHYQMPEMPLKVLVTLDFEETDSKTKMSLRHEGLPEEMADDCVKGWNSCFDKMEAKLV